VAKKRNYLRQPKTGATYWLTNSSETQSRQFQCVGRGKVRLSQQEREVFFLVTGRKARKQHEKHQ